MSEPDAVAEVDKHACIGAGLCMEIAPGAFEFGPDEKAEFHPEAGADRGTLLEAQQSCPAAAIRVLEKS